MARLKIFKTKPIGVPGQNEFQNEANLRFSKQSQFAVGHGSLFFKTNPNRLASFDLQFSRIERHASAFNLT